MTLKIRHAQLHDLTQIVELYGSIGDSPLDPFANVRRLRKLDRRHLLIAEEDGEFAGFTYYFIHRKPWFDPGVDQYASAMELHVRPELQGRGVGSRLLRRALAEISRAQIRVVYIDTGEENQVALHIYRRAGFCDFRKQVKLKLDLNRRTIRS